MKIYAFTSIYPNLFKPYYDAHFANLLERDHELHIFTLGSQQSPFSGKFQEYDLADRLTKYFPTDLRSIVRFGAPALGTAISQPEEARRLLDLVATFTSSPKERLKHLVRALGLPFSSPDFSIVHGHYPMRLFPWLRALYPNSPVGLYYYGGLPAEVASFTQSDLTRVFQVPDRVFTPSCYARSEASRLGCPAHKVRVLPLSFDMSDFDLEEPKTYRPEGLLRLISVGRLSKGKGQEHVLQALAHLRRERPQIKFRYRIVGDGPCEPALKEMAERLDLQDRVRFLGSRPFDEVRELYRESDALVLASYATSQWTETQGTVIQEAMLMENTVITTDTGGVPESIPPCMQRFHVEANNMTALENAIADVHELSTEKLAELGKRGREWVRENFRIEDFNRRLLEEMRDLGNSDQRS